MHSIGGSILGHTWYDLQLEKIYFFPSNSLLLGLHLSHVALLKNLNQFNRPRSSTPQALKSDNFKTVQAMISKPSEFYQNLSWNI